jgi:hypothetical protein
MHGKRVQLYYRGIVKRCTNCFGIHKRKNCTEEKVPWIKYWEQFINNYPEIPKESYGRWATIIDGIRPKRNANKVIMTVQQTQSTLAGVQSKTTKPTMQTTKKNDSEMRKEDKQEAVGENKSKTEDDIDQEELYQVLQGLVGSGMPIKAI